MTLRVRLALTAVGVGVFAVYALGAVALYLLLAWLVKGAALGTTVAVLLAAAAVGGYLNYRAGPARVVAGLRTRELSRSRAPGLHRRLAALSDAMDVRMPPLLVADLGAPNALSVGGPRRGVVVLDGRLLRLLSADELEGILAHELAHMEGYDTFVQTMAVGLVRALGGVVGVLLSPVFLLVYGIDRGLAWAAGRPARHGSTGEWVRVGARVTVGLLLSVLTLAVLAYARRREFVADRRAAEVTGRPEALARALWKIRRASDPGGGLQALLYTHTGEKQRSGLRRWLSTHPPLEERIGRLTGATVPVPAASPQR